MMVVGPACFPGAGPGASGPQSKVSTGCQLLLHCTEGNLSPGRCRKLEEAHSETVVMTRLPVMAHTPPEEGQQMPHPRAHSGVLWRRSCCRPFFPRMTKETPPGLVLTPQVIACPERPSAPGSVLAQAPLLPRSTHGKEEVMVLGLVRAEGGGKGKGCTRNLGSAPGTASSPASPKHSTPGPGMGAGGSCGRRRRRGSSSLWGSRVSIRQWGTWVGEAG